MGGAHPFKGKALGTRLCFLRAKKEISRIRARTHEGRKTEEAPLPFACSPQSSALQKIYRKENKNKNKNKKTKRACHLRGSVEERGGTVAERLERWTCNPEALSSSPTLTASWICSRVTRPESRVPSPESKSSATLVHGQLRLTGSPPTSWDS